MTLDPTTTALLIFDIVDPICTRQPVYQVETVMTPFPAMSYAAVRTALRTDCGNAIERNNAFG